MPLEEEEGEAFNFLYYAFTRENSKRASSCRKKKEEDQKEEEDSKERSEEKHGAETVWR